MSFSYSFRDRPRLSDRIRGKSGDELFNELRKEFDQDRKSFFDRPSSNFGSSAGSTFPRAAHFFDDPLSSRGHTDIRSHLEDLAQRHPEFADQLRYPAWTDEPVKSNTWGRKRRGSQDTEEASKQQNKEEHNDSLRGRAKENLRNTVPDMGQKQQQTEDKESRGQRSWSAPPPDNRNEKPRFVSKIEIHPVNPDAKPQPPPQQSSSTGDATKPPMAPPKPQPQPQSNQQQQQQPQHKTSTVRHIPIFVEGRDEPLLPKVEPEFTQHAAPQQHFAAPPQSHYQHPPRKQTPPRFEQNQPRFEQQVPIQTRFEKEVPIQTRFEKEVPVQSRFEKEVPIQARYEQHPSQPQHHPQQQQQPQQQAHPEPQQPAVNPNDPLYRVECVQKDVDELKVKIENFKGTSRKDKTYIFLDEELTRNLIKLDNIETEGREEVRAARKNTIKCIQNYISILENKVPVPSDNEKKKDMDVESVEKIEEKSEAMETEQQSQDVGNSSGKDNQQSAGDSQQKIDPEQPVEKPMEVDTPKPEEKTTGDEAPKEESNAVSGGKQSSAAEEMKETLSDKKEEKEPSLNEATENKSA